MAITKVQYFHENTLIGEVTSAPFDRIKWQNVPEGEYQLTAKLWIDGVEQATSQVVNFSAVLKYPNTFIGNAASLYPTKEDLALALGISSLNILTYNIKGDEVQALITQEYVISDQLFRNTGITYYEDLDGNVMSGGGGSWFRENPNFILAVLPNVDYVGTSSAYESVFNSVSANIEILASQEAETYNGGVPDPDFTQDGHSVIYRQNETTPGAVSDLSAGTIYATAVQLNFTPSASTNTIKEYHVYDGTTRLGKVKNSGEYIVGLNEGTAYNLKIFAVDQYFNKSTASNIISVTTNAQAEISQDSLTLSLNSEHDASYSSGSEWKDLVKGQILNIQGASYNATEQSIKIDAVGEYLSFENSFKIEAGSDFSFGCFMKVNAWEGNNPGLWRVDSPSVNFNIFNGTSGRPWIRLAGTDILKGTSGTQVTIGNYVYVVFVVHSHTAANPGYAKVMIDGVEAYSTSHTQVTPEFSLVELLRHNINEYVFADFKAAHFYNKALTELEAANNNTSLRNFFVTP